MYSAQISLIYFGCFLLFLVFPQSGSWSCNDTSDNLMIRVEDEVTTVYTEISYISAYANYPPDAIRVQYYMKNMYTGVLLPSNDDSCRYVAGLFYVYYDYYGLQFIVTFIATDKLNESNIATNITTVYVEVAAEISLQDLSSILIKEKDVFLINCSAIGNPPPTLWWNLTDHGINVEQSKIFEAVPQYKPNISSITTLTIGSAYGALFNDSGSYTCNGQNTLSADNTTHEDSATVQIFVHVPVEFINSSGIIQIKEGSSIDITCEFRGFPEPQITWLNNTAYDSSTDSYNDIFYLSTLHIVKSKCDDERAYNCFAENKILGDDQRNASGYVNVNFIDPSIHDLSVDSDQCNGTSMSITWTPTDWPTSLMYNITYSSDSGSAAVQTGNSYYMVNTKPEKEYDINVTAISECNKISNVTSTRIRTGIYLPSEPVNVSATQTTDTKCTLQWNLPNITYNNVSRYYIFYHSYIRGSICEEYDTRYTTCENLSCTTNMTAINSQYYFEVAAENCAGIGPSEKSIGSCSTDTAAPTNVTSVKIEDIETNSFGSIEVSVSGFKVIIPEQSQQYGNISCYYIVMVRYGELYDTSDQVQDRVTIDPNNLSTIATASIQDVQDGEPYFAIASKNSSTVLIGDDTVSSCNGLTRLSNENFPTWNRNLTENRSYDMFILTTVLSVKDENKMYSQSSEGTFMNAVYFPEPEPLTTPVVAIVVPTFVVMLLIIGMALFWFYRRKQRTKKKNKDSTSADHVDPYTPDEPMNEDHKYEDIKDERRQYDHVANYENAEFHDTISNYENWNVEFRDGNAQPQPHIYETTIG